MNAANFTMEFTQLLMRYTVPRTPNEKEKLADGLNEPLTPEVLIELMKESLPTILGTPNLPNITENVYKTPVNDFVINTPDAPTVARSSLNGVGNGMGNEMGNGIGNGLVSEQYMNTISEKVEASDKKKDPSPSRIHLSVMGRSGTFVHEDDNPISKDMMNEKTSDGTLQQKLDDLHKCAVEIISKHVEVISKFDEVISKLDEVIKPPTAVPAKAIRRLSSVGAYSTTTRNSSMMRSIQPTKVRRSLTTFPGTTPTSSRLNDTLVIGEPLSKRKSSSSTSLHVTSTATPGNQSKSFLTPSANRSNTSISLPPMKKSPVNDSRPAKNPKYAHIQSSIPKPSFVPKKKT